MAPSEQACREFIEPVFLSWALRKCGKLKADKGLAEKRGIARRETALGFTSHPGRLTEENRVKTAALVHDFPKNVNGF